MVTHAFDEEMMKQYIPILFSVCLLMGCSVKTSSISIQVIEGDPPAPSLNNKAPLFSHMLNNEAYLRNIVTRRGISERLSISETEAVKALRSRIGVSAGKTPDILIISIRGFPPQERDFILNAIAETLQAEKLSGGRSPEQSINMTIKVLD